MQITKYGEEIGQATANIKAGEYVHVHNLESIRARGDWRKEIKSKMDFYGYVRKDGRVGSRNYVAVIPSVVCVNEVVENIVSITRNCRGILHHQGCCQLPRFKQVTDSLIKLGQTLT